MKNCSLKPLRFPRYISTIFDSNFNDILLVFLSNLKAYIIAFTILLTSNVSQSQETLNSHEADSILEHAFGKMIISGNFENTLKDMNKVLEYGKREKDSFYISLAYFNLAIIYSEHNELLKAKHYFNEAIKSEPTEDVSHIYNGLGNVHLELKDTINALTYYYKALELEAKYEYSGATDNNIGALLMRMGKLEEAKIHLQNAISHYDSNYYQPEIFIDANLDLACIAISEKNYQDAFWHLKQSDSLASSLKNHYALFESERHKTEIYKALNQNTKVLSSQEHQIQLLENINRQQDSLYTKNLDLELNVLKQQNTIELNKQISQAQAEKLLHSRMLSIFSICLVVILGLFSFILFKNKERRKKLNALLVERNTSLIKAKEEAEYASKLKETFFSTISHELRTPLYAVTGITDILLEENQDKSQQDKLEVLKSSGEHLLSLINNVLHINKLDSNKIELNPTVFCFKKLANDIKSTLHFIAEENHNKLIVNVDDDIPPNITGDILKIKQVLINLVNNALKFTHDGTVVLSIKLVSRNSELAKIKVSVADTGIGIPEELHEKIFEDFYQQSMQLERNYEGTGLGLPIVKKLLHAMDSKIAVQSKPNVGTTFDFTLPLRLSKVRQIDEKETTANPTELEGKHFLCVDDNAVNQMITKRLLTGRGATVTIANNGLEAISLAKQNEFDVILMDIHMPKMNGYEATQNIRTFDETTPIIALTALKIDDDKNDVYKCGMNDVIVKPFIIENFFQKINNHLSETKAS